MNMATQDGKLWMNGTMIDQPDAKVHVLTHSLHYGIAVFEGVRAYQTADKRTAIFRLISAHALKCKSIWVVANESSKRVNFI